MLASSSEIRFKMLLAAGVDVEIMPARIDERALETPLLKNNAPAQAVAEVLAQAKAAYVSRMCPGRWVLGADQTLDCEDVMFHKPTSLSEARSQLAALSGRTHRLTSVAVLMQDGKPLASLADSAIMTMRRLDDAALDHYLALAGDAARSSVGCYQLEGLGIQLFERIEGNHFTILGLPLMACLAAMRKLGIVRT
jgi:septum formation protein